jgi:hypothetical protein
MDVMGAMAAVAVGEDVVMMGLGVVAMLMIVQMGQAVAGGPAAPIDARAARHRKHMAALRAERSRTPIGPRWQLDSWTDVQALSLTRFTKV